MYTYVLCGHGAVGVRVASANENRANRPVEGGEKKNQKNRTRKKRECVQLMRKCREEYNVCVCVCRLYPISASHLRIFLYQRSYNKLCACVHSIAVNPLPLHPLFTYRKTVIKYRLCTYEIISQYAYQITMSINHTHTLYAPMIFSFCSKQLKRKSRS